MSDAQQQADRARRERVIILATDTDTGKVTILTPRPDPGVSDEDYLNGLRTQMAMHYPQMHYAREVITYEPLPDMGAPSATSAPALVGKGSVESPIQTLIEFPSEWTR